MTDFLLGLFVKNSKNTDSPAVRSAIGRTAGIVGIVCNGLLFAGKAAVGLITGSVSVAADAVNNLNDAASAIVTLVGFRLAEIPPDKHHPYGHARFEYLAGLTVAAMILLIGAELAKTSVGKIISPEPVDFSPMIAIVLTVSIGVKLWLHLFNRTLAGRIESTALAAASADCRNDMIATGAVLLSSVVGAVTGWPLTDGLMGLAVAILIICSGAGLARDTISPLLGENADPRLQKQITELVYRYPTVLGFHDLMVHDYGPGQRFATIHVEMDHREDSMVCHEIIDEIERECLQSLKVHLTIHLDPVVVGDPELDRLHRQVIRAVKAFDKRLSIHDFRMVQGKNHVNLIFDMAVPDDLKDRTEEIEMWLKQTLAGQVKKYHIVITYDSAAFSAAAFRGANLPRDEE